jgi:hypothetical protein
MNTTKSWFQKARAQTLKTQKHNQSNNTSDTTRNADPSNDQDDKNAQTPDALALAPAVEKTLTEFLYKPATVRGFPAMIPDVVNAYNLDWWELEPFLKRIYPGVPFKENVRIA